VKQRIYLDTSVLSALDDTRAPDRQQLTREFFDRIHDFDAAVSTLTRDEINQTQDASRREQILLLLDELRLLEVTDEARAIAKAYLDASIFPPSVPEDALHVAIAVAHRQDAVVSWNFKHLVNQRRRAAVQAINASLSLPSIAIIAPPEL
jgi:predicted nucleic acid-binding protein